MNCVPCGTPQTGVPFEPGSKITIEEANGNTATYDFLVIACDPQEDNLPEEVMKKTNVEKEVFSDNVMKSFIFQTTLMKFPKVNEFDDPVEIFNPVNLKKSAGLLHSYRSETRKEAYQLTVQSKNSDPKAYFDSLLNKVSYEYVTMYQLIDPTKAHKMNEDEMWKLLQEQIRDPKNKTWFPYDASRGVKVAQFHTKYFDHFTIPALMNRQSNTRTNNWKILDIQGEKNTIYVHACTAFESVLHIYNYIELLQQTCPESFPTDNQSLIAVVGAGPSGLLISRKLIQMGYTNITIYESKSNNSGPHKLYAGKTQTNVIQQPHLNYRIPAELGTCYLSPAYMHMYDDFDKTNLLGSEGDKNELISLDQIDDGPIVKDIITDGQFAPDGPVMRLWREYPDILNFEESEPGQFPYRMNFEKYQVVKGFEEHYKGKHMSVRKLKRAFHGFLPKVIGKAAIDYIIYHHENYGKYVPLPPEQKRIKAEIFSNDIYSFLKKKKWLSLLGLLQFGYSLQGYGSTAEGDTISAFYLLMWVTPDVLMTFIHNDVKAIIKKALKTIHINPTWFKKDVPVVAALSKGWGDIWKNLKLQLDEQYTKDNRKKVEMNYATKIKKILRHDA